jgi:pimeloyl-ACP methyl ester carboxylesterase
MTVHNPEATAKKAHSAAPTRLWLACLLVPMLLLSACGGSADEPPTRQPMESAAAALKSPGGCPLADHMTRVPGLGECLVIETALGAGGTRTLLVMLHGDVGAGGPADYMYSFAHLHAGPGITAVAMLRPGYYDSQGRQSTGPTNHSDNYTAANIGAVADAIRRLKAFHHAERVVVLGHSGGAAITGVMLGQFPGEVDAALLVSCPCDLVAWRNDLGVPQWINSLSPSDFVQTVAADARVVALTGAKDVNTKPFLAQDYVESLQERGVDAQFVSVPLGQHSFGTLKNSAEFETALGSLLHN